MEDFFWKSMLEVHPSNNLLHQRYLKHAFSICLQEVEQAFLIQKMCNFTANFSSSNS